MKNLRFLTKGLEINASLSTGFGSKSMLK